MEIWSQLKCNVKPELSKPSVPQTFPIETEGNKDQMGRSDDKPGELIAENKNIVSQVIVNFKMLDEDIKKFDYNNMKAKETQENQVAGQPQLFQMDSIKLLTFMS